VHDPIITEKVMAQVLGPLRLRPHHQVNKGGAPANNPVPAVSEEPVRTALSTILFLPCTDGKHLDLIERMSNLTPLGQQCEVVFGSVDRSPDTKSALSGSLVECSKQLLFS